MSINLKKTNFAKSKLSGALLTAGMSFSVTSGDGVKFPAIGSGYPFRAIIFGASSGAPEQDLTREIIECYRNAADAFTITSRGLEGTSAKDWSDQDNIVLSLTAGVLQEIENEALNRVEAIVTSVSSLTSIDCSLGSYFIINISASATISLANVASSKIYTFAIKNTSASSITVTLPTGSIATNPSFTIAAGLQREFNLIYANSVNRWQVGGEMNTI